MTGTTMTGDQCGRKRLTRAMRLRTKREFTQIREQGRRLAKGCLIANWLPLSPNSEVQLGVVTSRRLGNAVIRARARRLLREAFRLHQCDFKHSVAIVLVARASINGKKLAAVEHDYLSALRQARLLKESL
ncbi:MAG: ribonuclease P protein component [Verrucomicrobia bacterium]|nr:ribonuclease P protein component [Verrucomicrobiota bacterium]